MKKFLFLLLISISSTVFGVGFEWNKNPKTREDLYDNYMIDVAECYTVYQGEYIPTKVRDQCKEDRTEIYNEQVKKLFPSSDVNKSAELETLKHQLSQCELSRKNEMSLVNDQLAQCENNINTANNEQEKLNKKLEQCEKEPNSTVKSFCKLDAYNILNKLLIFTAILPLIMLVVFNYYIRLYPKIARNS